MGYTATPVNGIPIPDNKEYVNQAWKFSGTAASRGEPFSVMRFTSMTDLATKLVGATLTPVAGMIAFVAADNAFYGYVSGAWHRIYPTEKQILTGTTAPASGLGAVGDIYFQY